MYVPLGSNDDAFQLKIDPATTILLLYGDQYVLYLLLQMRILGFLF